MEGLDSFCWLGGMSQAGDRLHSHSKRGLLVATSGWSFARLDAMERAGCFQRYFLVLGGEALPCMVQQPTATRPDLKQKPVKPQLPLRTCGWSPPCLGILSLNARRVKARPLLFSLSSCDGSPTSAAHFSNTLTIILLRAKSHFTYKPNNRYQIPTTKNYQKQIDTQSQWPWHLSVMLTVRLQYPTLGGCSWLPMTAHRAHMLH